MDFCFSMDSVCAVDLENGFEADFHFDFDLDYDLDFDFDFDLDFDFCCDAAVFFDFASG